MPTTYVPTPTRLVDFPRPNDGERRNAASVNQSTGPLGDGIAFLNDAADVAPFVPAINFPTKVTASIGQPACACFSPAKREWLVATYDAEVHASIDGALSFGSDLVSGIAAGTEHCLTIAADLAGNAVVSLDVAKVLQLPASGSPTLVNLAADTTNASVVYDPINTKWCVLGDDGLGVVHCATSTNRTTWTANDPTGTHVSGNYFTVHDLTVDPVNGKIVAACANASFVRTIYSADGGLTWTTGASLTVATLPDQVHLSYDVESETFMLSLLDVAGATKIWTSTLGTTTWTLKATLTNADFYRPAPVGTAAGTVWVAMARHDLPGASSSEEIVCSSDGGATWRPIGVRTTGGGASIRGVHSSPYAMGCLALTDASIFVGTRYGVPSMTALT